MSTVDRRRHPGRLLPLVAVLGLALAACGADDPAATESGPSEAMSSEAMSSDAETSEAEARGDDPAEDAPGAEADAGSETAEAETGGGGADTEPPEDPAGDGAPADETAADEAGDHAADVPDLLDFTAPAVGGGQVEGADAAGHPVALWFWAPWCPSCNREAPAAAQLAHDFGDEVRFIGVAGLDDISEMEDFVAAHDVGHFPHAATEDGELWVRFDVTYQPAWIILDADGEVVLSGIRPSLDAVHDALVEVSSSG